MPVSNPPPSTSIGGTPSTQAIGDAAAEGSSGVAARSDHKHALPAFGATPSTQAFGDSAAGGTAATPARSDHKHAMPATLFAVPGTQVYNGTKNGTWADLDLSGVIGARACLVLLSFTFNNGGYTSTVYLRKNGEANDYNSACAASVAGAASLSVQTQYAIIVTDTNGVIEWKCSCAVTTISVVVEAYLHG